MDPPTFISIGQICDIETYLIHIRSHVRSQVSQRLYSRVHQTYLLLLILHIEWFPARTCHCFLLASELQGKRSEATYQCAQMLSSTPD